MTVVVLTLTYDGRDGLSMLSRQVAAALSDIFPGETIEVLSLAGPAAIGDASPRVIGCLGSRTRLGRQAVAAAARRPDLVVTLHTHLLPLTLPFVAAGSALAHVLVGIEAWRALSRLQREGLQRASSVIAISDYTRRRFVACNPGWVPVDVSVCHPCTPALPAPAGDRDVPAPGYALIVGRMAATERYKGHDRLIDAWPHVSAEVPGARLVIAGGGDDAPRLRERVASAGLEHAVRFTGQVDNGRLAALYAGAGAFVLPSRHEGLGYVFLEAMAAGCACIGAHGAADEIIRDGETGFLVDADDAIGMTGAIVGLLQQPDRARLMGEAGRARAREIFSAARFTEGLRRALAPAVAC